MKKRLVCTVVFMVLLCTIAVFANDGASESKRMRPALLVIDVQQYYLPMMSAEDTTLALPRIDWAVNLFRKKGMPIIRIYHDEPGAFPEPGDADFEFPDRIPVTESDPKIIKHHGSAFSGTELAEMLKDKEVNTVFLCGLSATGCVLATYFGAHEHDLKVFMIEDALISWDATHTNMIEAIFNTVELGTLKFMVDYITE